MGGGGKRLLTLAGREADIVGLHIKVNDDGTIDASETTQEPQVLVSEEEGMVCREMALINSRAAREIEPTRR
jgi:hypothetical protein